MEVLCSGEVQGRDKEDDMVEDSEEERRLESSSSDNDVPLAGKHVKSSPGAGLLYLPGVEEVSMGLSYTGSGQRAVCSGGHSRGLSFHPYPHVGSRGNGSSTLLVQS